MKNEVKSLTLDEIADLTDDEREKYIVTSEECIREELTAYINRLTKEEQDLADPWIGPELRKAEWREQAHQLKVDMLGWTSSLNEVAQNATVEELVSILPRSIKFEASLRTLVESPRFSKFPKVVIDQVKDLAAECLSQVTILNSTIKMQIEIYRETPPIAETTLSEYDTNSLNDADVSSPKTTPATKQNHLQYAEFYCKGRKNGLNKVRAMRETVKYFTISEKTLARALKANKKLMDIYQVPN